MALIDRYIGKQVLAATLFGVLVLCMVLLFGNLFKEIRPLLVEQGAPLSMVLQFVLYVLPFSLMFTLPWGFLTAILLVFGKLSSDNEITALRMSGRGLGRLAVPVLVIGFCFCFSCYWLNTRISPAAKANIAQLLFNTASRDPNALLQEGQLQTRFEGQKLLIEQRVGERLIGFHLYQEATETQPALTVHAAEVELDFDEGSKILELTLHDATIETLVSDGDQQLVLVKRMPWRLDLSKVGKRREKANQLTNPELDQRLADPNLSKKRRTQYTAEKRKRLSFSFACLALGFIGVPLGVRHQRKETSAGFGLGIAIAVAYFVLMIVAESGGEIPGILGDVILWLPNIACIGLGLFFFRRASRG